MAKIISLLLLSTLLFALLIFAQEPESAGPATFAGSLTLWIAIIIGFIASFITFYYGFRIKGSVVGNILNLFGAGMFFVVLGFLSVVVAWAQPSTQKIVHDLLFIIGYILMLIAATNMRKLSA